MNGVYRSLPDRRRLVPRERDPVTGRRTRARDEKHERRAPRSRSRALVAATVAIVAVVALVGVGLAVAAARSDDDESAAPSERAEQPSSTTDAAGEAPPTSVTDPPATAITLQYSGGSITRSECTDLQSGSCSGAFPGETAYDPLTVHCTPEGCSVTFVEIHPLAPHVEATGTVPAGDGCQPTVWTLALRAVGTAVTRGIEHPARLVGTATQLRPAEVLPTVNCLGGDEEYAYDATPG